MNDTQQNPPSLTARQRKFLEALLESPSITAAASRAGVHRCTAQGWMKNPAFRAELDRAQRIAFDAALSRIASLAGEASNRLVALVQSPNESISLGAVRLALEVAGAHLDARHIAEKLAAIEEHLALEETKR